MFENASRMKLRFESNVGLITTEDLWDLPLVSASNGVSLDEIAKSMNKQLKDSEESFVEATNPNEALELAFNIVKYIIKIKLAEAEVRKAAANKKAMKEKILSVLADKEDDALKNKSPNALKKMLDEL